MASVVLFVDDVVYIVCLWPVDPVGGGSSEALLAGGPLTWPGREGHMSQSNWDSLGYLGVSTAFVYLLGFIYMDGYIYVGTICFVCVWGGVMGFVLGFCVSLNKHRSLKRITVTFIPSRRILMVWLSNVIMQRWYCVSMRDEMEFVTNFANSFSYRGYALRQYRKAHGPN